MKLEPAQKLDWPWPTEWVYLVKKNGPIESRHIKESWGKYYDLQKVIQNPSVEEMLERMPESTCIEKRGFDTGYRAFNREIVTALPAKAGSFQGQAPVLAAPRTKY